jgi:hypothetical protein
VYLTARCNKISGKGCRTVCQQMMASEPLGPLLGAQHQVYPQV